MLFSLSPFFLTNILNIHHLTLIPHLLILYIHMFFFHFIHDPPNNVTSDIHLHTPHHNVTSDHDLSNIHTFNTSSTTNNSPSPNSQNVNSTPLLVTISPIILVDNSF